MVQSRFVNTLVSVDAFASPPCDERGGCWVGRMEEVGRLMAAEEERGDQRRKWQSHQTHEPGRPADGSLSVQRPPLRRSDCGRPSIRRVGIRSLLAGHAMEWLERGATAADGDVGPPTAQISPRTGAPATAREMPVATLHSGGPE